jgi:hypothetical protein
MQRVAGANYLANGNGAGKNAYQDYNPATGQAGTTPTAAALNALQEEIAGMIEAQGLALNPADNTQLQQAISLYVGTQMAPYETVAAATAALASAISGLETPSEVATAISSALMAYAPLASPALTGSPTAPTAPANDNTTKIANTSWIKANIQALVTSCIAAVATAAGFSCSLGSVNWSITFPNWLGGWIVQCGTASFSGINPHGTVSVSWPTNFPTACLGAFPTAIGTNSSGGSIASNLSGLPSISGATIMVDAFGVASVTGTVQVLAFGH